MADPGATSELAPLHADISQEEFTGLVGRHNAELLRFAYGMTGDRAMAEDAVQTCWQAAWRSRTEIRDPDRLRGWLFTVTANNVRRQLRRRALGRALHLRVSQPVDAPAPNPEHVDLARSLSRLSFRDRQLIALRYGLGWTSDEIAPLLGLSASGTRRRLQRVIGVLRMELRDD